MKRDFYFMVFFLLLVQTVTSKNFIQNPSMDVLKSSFSNGFGTSLTDGVQNWWNFPSSQTSWANITHVLVGSNPTYTKVDYYAHPGNKNHPTSTNTTVPVDANPLKGAGVQPQFPAFSHGILVDNTSSGGQNCTILKQAEIVIYTSKSQFLEIIPNPAVERFRINSYHNVSRVCLYDLNGKLARCYSKEREQYDIIGLPGGLYRLAIEIDSGIVISEKLLIAQ